MSNNNKAKNLNKKKRPPFLQLLGLIMGGLIVVAFSVLGVLWVLSLRDPTKLQAFQATVSSLGPLGWLILLAIQYIQIVIAFIPGGPIQIVAGALYGPLGGFATCLIGTILASLTVFSLVKKHGTKVISLFVDEKDILKYKFLNNSKQLELILFLLFFIPGTPKDALTYIFAITPIPTKRFMFISILARIPAMLTSVFAGSSIIKGDWLKAGIMFLSITAISLLGVLLQKKIKALLKHNHNDN